MSNLRVVDELCSECGETFLHQQRLWAIDCDGNIAVGRHRKKGLWYGGDGMMLLEMPTMVWTTAVSPGAEPVCDDCIAHREF
mgnify:CR=1 FL=1